MTTVSIPNVGVVNFPDGMSPEDISKAIQENIIPNAAKQAQPQAEAPQATTPTPAAPEEKAPGVIDTIADMVTPGQETIGALKKGLIGVKQSAVADKIASMMELQAADKEKYGEHYEGAPTSALDAITARDKTIAEDMQKIAGYGEERADIEKQYGINPLQKQIRTLASSPEYNQLDTFDKLKAYGSTLWNNKSDIPGYIAGIGLESAPASLVMAVPATIAAFAKLGPGVAAGSVGVTSAMMEFGNEYADLRAQGMDHDEAWQKASVKSGVIGLFDAASANSAGHAAGEILKDIEKHAVKSTLKDTGKEVGVQALYGMGGEALGSIASNQQVDPISVLEEGVGEIFGAPMEAVGTFKSKQQQAIAAAANPVTAQTPTGGHTPDNVQPVPAAPAPQVQSADNTPIPIQPLNAGEQELAAKANAPVTPEATPDIETHARAKSEELGIPLEDARKLAQEEIQNGTVPSNGVNTGTNQPSVPMPQAGLQPTGGVASPQPAGLGSTVGPVGEPGAGAGNVQAAQPSALNLQASTAATNNLMAVLQGAADGFTISQQEYAQTGQSPTLKKVKAYLTKSLTPLLGPKKTKAYVNYLTEEGGLDSSDYGSNSEYFQEALEKMVPKELQPSAPAQQVVPATPEAAPAPQATKGKRGRPAVELTPEEQAAKKQAKSEQIKNWKVADKAIAAARQVLENPEPIREDFATQDAYLEAGMRYRSERNQALDTLHAAATGPFRGGKLGATAKVGLGHPSITALERSNIKQRAEIKKKALAQAGKPSKSESSMKSDTRYQNFDDATQAANHVIKNGNPFESELAKRLKPFLKGVNLTVVNAENEMPANLRATFDGANGLYTSSNLNGQTYRNIYLRGENFGGPDYQGTNNTVFLHEALHAAVNSKIDEWVDHIRDGKEVPEKLGKAIDALMNVMHNASREFAYQTLTGYQNIDPRIAQLFRKETANGVEIYNDLKEFVAYGLTEDAMQQFLLQTKGEINPSQPGRFKSLFNRFVNAIRDLFDMDESHQSGLQDLILATEGLLKYEGQAPEKPQVSAARPKKEKQVKIDRDVKKVMTSNIAQDVTEGVGNLVAEGHNFEDFKDYLAVKYAGMSQEATEQVIKALRTSDLIRWKGDEIPGLKVVDDMTQKMSAMRSSMMAAYAKKADELARFISSKKNNMRVLGNAMHLARLKEVTPDAHTSAVQAIKNDARINELENKLKDPNTDPSKLASIKGQITMRTNDINIVYDAWEKLGQIAGGQEMYKRVRQFYKDNFALTRNLLDERIERLQELPGDAEDESTPKGQLMAEIRKMQEKNNIVEYFPFMRHGSVWLRESGKDRAFHLFDTVEERERYKLKRARDLKTTPQDLLERQVFSEGNDIASLRNATADDSKMLKNMFEIIDKADMVDKEGLKNDLYQTWLMTMPERSIRKQFMNAENVTGFSADIFRNFTESANRMASQAPKLKYADQVSTAISAARDSLAGNPDQAKLGLFVDAVGRRANEVLNPNAPNAISSAVTRYAYYMLLTGTASAAVQMTAIPVMVMPTLAARYGVGATTAKMASYAKVWDSLGVTANLSHDNIPSANISMGESARIKNNPLLNKAFNELRERGIFSFTESNLLSQRGRTPLNAYTGIPKKALRITANIMSGLFSGAERLSREQASMMTFELAYDKTKDFDKAIDAAVSMVQDNMGRYDAMERPELFKYLPVVSQFKMYAMTMSFFFMRHGYNMISKSISDPKEAAQCAAILSGTLMMGAMFHGIKGMPLYSVVGAVVEALDNPEGDDEEKRKRRAKNPLVYANADLRFRQFLNDNFGEIKIPGAGGMHRLSDVIYGGPISELTDMNVGSRTSFDNLWFRSPTPSKTDQGWFQNFLLSNLGPGISTIAGQVGALDDFEAGHIERGLEKLLPAFFKNPLVATRLGTEGAKTKEGSMIIDPKDITTANVIAQSTGLAPTKLARLQEAGFELKGEYVKAEQDRSKILQRLDDAVLNKDFTGKQKDLQPIINQVRQFNTKYPMDKVMIDTDALQNALDAALTRRAMTYKGVQIPSENLLPYFIPALKQAAPLPKQ